MGSARALDVIKSGNQLRVAATKFSVSAGGGLEYRLSPSVLVLHNPTDCHGLAEGGDYGQWETLRFCRSTGTPLLPLRMYQTNAVKLLTLAAHVLGSVGLLLYVDSLEVSPLMGGSPCENRLQPQFQNS